MMCFSQDNYYRQPQDAAAHLMKLGKEVSIALNAPVLYSPSWGIDITNKIKKLAEDIWDSIMTSQKITGPKMAQWEKQKDIITGAIMKHYQKLLDSNKFRACITTILNKITKWIYPFEQPPGTTNMWINTQIDHLEPRCFKTMHSAELFTDCLVFLDSTLMETGVNTTATA